MAWALTTHKVQGQTVKDPRAVGLDINSTFGPAQAYVMLGRTENLQQLYLADFDEKKIHASADSLIQSNKLKIKAESYLEHHPWLTLHDSFKVCALNIQSLMAHFDDILVDNTLLKGDVIALSETWYPKENFQPPDLLGYQAIHVMSGRGKGLTLYTKKEYVVLNSKTVNLNQYQLISAKLQGVTIIAAYRSPSYSSHVAFMSALSKLIPSKGPTIICGDFNIHPNEQKDYYNPLVNALASLGLVQLIDKPTHIEGHILDHMYVRDVDIAGWQLHHPYFSDHDAICCRVNL